MVKSDMDNKMLELNKKLAEFRFRDEGIMALEVGSQIAIITSKVNTNIQLFTQSLDACRDWLIPKVLDKGLIFSHTFPQFETVKWIVDIVDVEIEAEAETLALALCLAIEKLIDGS